MKMRKRHLKLRGIALLQHNVVLQNHKNHTRDLAFAYDYYRKVRGLLELVKSATGFGHAGKSLEEQREILRGRLAKR